MRIFIFLIISAATLFSQNFGTWKNYTDMSNVMNFVVLPNGVAAATSGGFFIFNETDSTYFTFTKSEGLKSQNITAVTKDNSGKIWIGTEEGFIHIINPSSFSIETIRDIFSTDKTNKSINYLYAKGDTIFAATDFGLSLIDSKTYTFFDTVLKFDILPTESKVNTVFIKDLVYVGTDMGLAVSKPNATNLTAPESWTAYGSSQGLNGEKIFAIDDFNGIIAATDKGIFSFDGNTWTKLINKNITVRDISVYNNKLYYISIKDTLSNQVVSKLKEFDGSNETLILNKLKVEFNSVSSGSNGIFVASSNGIIKIINNTEITIKPNGPVQNSVHRLAIDKFGNLWTVSGKSPNGSGINLFDGSHWTNFNKTNTDAIGSNAFYGVYPAEDGRVFFGNWGNGYSIYENGNFTTYNSQNTNLTGIQEDLNYIVITDLELDSQNNLWMTNSETAASEIINLFTADGNEYNYKVKTPITPVDAVCFNLTIDQFGTKWFNIVSAVSGQIGLYYFNENKTYENLDDDVWGILNTNDGLNSNTINDIVIDKRGELWVGTSLGINIIPNPSSPRSNIGSSFPVRQQNIIAIAVDPLNRKWVGTNEGVFLLSSDGTALIESFNKDNSPLPTNTIKSITIDEKTGVVYFGTDFGISSYSSISAKPNDDFSQLFVYPNPVEISNTTSAKITIDGLIKETTIKILSISGNLIREIITPGGRVAFWDLRNEQGNLVPSGIYILVAYDAEANLVASSKIAVIKR